MNLHRRLAMLFVVSALVGCSQQAAGLVKRRMPLLLRTTTKISTTGVRAGYVSAFAKPEDDAYPNTVIES
jgi:hypothetical protein